MERNLIPPSASQSLVADSFFFFRPRSSVFCEDFVITFPLRLAPHTLSPSPFFFREGTCGLPVCGNTKHSYSPGVSLQQLCFLSSRWPVPPPFLVGCYFPPSSSLSASAAHGGLTSFLAIPFFFLPPPWWRNLFFPSLFCVVALFRDNPDEFRLLFSFPIP